MVTISEKLLNELLAEITPEGEIVYGSITLHIQNKEVKKVEVRRLESVEKK